MSERSTEALVSAYLSDRAWDDRREAVVKTSEIVRETASALLESGVVGTQEVTALYRLCMNDSTYPVSSKRNEIDELAIPEETKTALKNRVDESVGTVGGLLFPVEVPDDVEDAVTECLDQLLAADDGEQLDDAVRQLASVDLPNVECGKISPILYYLHPEYYPVVNNMSRSGMVEYFAEEISNSLSDYPETAATYRSVRDSYGFQDNFRDLDYFFVWMNQRERTQERVSVATDRSYYWVNQGNQAEIRDEYIRAKIDGVWHHDLDQVDAGDIVFHNFEDKLIGISTVTGWREQYSFQDATFQRVGVEFQWFDEPVSVDAELKGQLDNPEFQQKYYPVNSEGNLKQAYLATLSPAAAEFLLDRVEGWSQLRTVDADREARTPVLEKPDEATTVARQLEAEKQIVLYGPPGTGKTYTAERFARWWVAQQDHSVAVEDRVETVTFHPSFTYEDFIEGLTAEAGDNGQIAYEVQDGILKRLSETATDAYEEAQATGTDAPRFVLVIDEINRGNLAQIFGETITLLEADKRGTTTVRLAHSDSEFTLPPNLYVIGTMNTADRSIALVDAALRRRFRFISRPPAFDDVVAAHDLPEQPIETGDAFESLLAASIATLQEMNDRIVQSADLGKGKQIGHTRLFGVDAAEDIRDVWRYDILPLLEEYYFGQFDRIRQELFDGGGEALFDWQRKRIRDFTVHELGDTLSAFVEGDVELPSAARHTDEASERTRRQWNRDTFFDAIEASFDDELTAVCRDFFEFGSTEADRVGYGTGKQTGAAQFYWDAYRDGDYLVYELRTDGTLQFRFWGAEKYDPELFEVFVDRIRPVLEDPIDVEYLLSEEFTRLQIPLERVQDDESRERVKDAIRTFVTDAADQAP